jgi:site-specific recombinase XerD
MESEATSTGGPGRAEAETSHRRFLATIQADPDRSGSTVSNYRRALRHLVAVAPVPPEELNDDHIWAFRERMDARVSPISGEPVKPSTVNLAIAGVRSYLKWVRRHDLMGHPGLNTRRDRRDRKRMRRERTLSEEEDMETMARCYEVGRTSIDPVTVRDHALVLFLLATGLRISEALDLRWCDLDLEKRTVHVWSGKGGKERLALMDDRATEVMARLRRMGHGRPRTAVSHIPGIEAWGDKRRLPFGENDPVFCGARPLTRMPSDSACYVAKKLTRRYLDNAYTPHCFRHTFCTRFLRHGKTLQDLETVMELAGHSSMATTQGYLDLDGRIRDERFDKVTEAHWNAVRKENEVQKAEENEAETNIESSSSDEVVSATNGA